MYWLFKGLAAKYGQEGAVMKVLPVIAFVGVLVLVVIIGLQYGEEVEPTSAEEQARPQKVEQAHPQKVEQTRPQKEEQTHPQKEEQVHPQKVVNKKESVKKYITLDLGLDVTMKLVRIPAGTFVMGSPWREKGRYGDEGPRRRVTITKPFYMGIYEVTREQYHAITGKILTGPKATITSKKSTSKKSTSKKSTNKKPTVSFRWCGDGKSQEQKQPSTRKKPTVTRKKITATRKKPIRRKFKGAEKPVGKLSWYDAVAFCKALSKKTGKTARLPTEAEWEYACRAGTTTPFNTGLTISGDQANYNGKIINNRVVNEKPGIFRNKVISVGSFKPNAFGLYDMHGNVWEWCSDWYKVAYAKADTRDPQGANSGPYRLLRGGSFVFAPAQCRSAYRYKQYPYERRSHYGFRVVIVLSKD